MMELRRRAWAVALVVGLCLVGLFFLMPSQLGHDTVYLSIGMGSFALILVGIRINRRPTASPGTSWPPPDCASRSATWPACGAPRPSSSPSSRSS